MPCSTALVRYRTNDYSVPTRYGFQDVVVKGFVDAVVILCGGAEIAKHPRSYGTGMFVADPLHYLALIETKPGALDQAAALQDWALPQVFQHLRHLLEARWVVGNVWNWWKLCENVTSAGPRDRLIQNRPLPDSVLTQAALP